MGSEPEPECYVGVCFTSLSIDHMAGLYSCEKEARQQFFIRECHIDDTPQKRRVGARKLHTAKQRIQQHREHRRSKMSILQADRPGLEESGGQRWLYHICYNAVGSE